jgi:hypothetical protein
LNIEELPSYVTDGDTRYFLTINRDVYGQWSAAYLAYDEDAPAEAPFAPMNGCATLAELATRMEAKLNRYRRS